jgi:hypothetical protein
MFMAVLGVLTCTALAPAADRDDCDVLPPWETPYWYSLLDMARKTAVYNTGVSADNPLTPPPPDVPFHVLVEDATIDCDEILYVPIFFVDDSGGAPAGFPKDIDD